MVDFAAHFTIHAIKIGFQKYYTLPGKFVLESRASTNKVSVVPALHKSE